MPSASSFLEVIIYMPIIILWIIGMILSFQRRRANKKRYGLLFFAFITLTVFFLVNYIVTIYSLAAVEAGQLSLEALSTTNIILRIATAVVNFAAILAIIMAIFSRSKKRK